MVRQAFRRRRVLILLSRAENPGLAEFAELGFYHVKSFG